MDGSDRRRAGLRTQRRSGGDRGAAASSRRCGRAQTGFSGPSGGGGHAVADAGFPLPRLRSIKIWGFKAYLGHFILHTPKLRYHLTISGQKIICFVFQCLEEFNV